MSNEKRSILPMVAVLLVGFALGVVFVGLGKVTPYEKRDESIREYIKAEQKEMNYNKNAIDYTSGERGVLLHSEARLKHLEELLQSPEWFTSLESEYGSKE